MSDFPWEVLVLALVLAINRLGAPRLYKLPAAFWGLQVVNLVLAVAAAAVGLPGMDAFPALGWLVAGLLVFHVLQNVTLRGAAETRERQAEAERERIKKLRALGPVPDGPNESPESERGE